jgi:MscS family membrane protein
VKLKGYDGTIEEVGLRSTRLRTLTGHHVTIPNEEVSKSDVENIDRRPYIRRRFVIALTYDTPPEKIRRAMEIVKEILGVPEKDLADARENSGKPPHPNEAINDPDFPPRVYFSELAAHSLELLVNYWYHPPEYWDFLDHGTQVNMQIIECFNAEDINFAFPTQTLHLAGDENYPLTFAPPVHSVPEDAPPKS